MNIYIILKLHLPSLFFFLTCLGISITANLKPENTPNWRWRNLFRHLCFFSLAKHQNMMTVIVKRLYFPLETIFLQIWSKLVSFMMKLFSATFCLLVQLFWNTVCIVMAHNSIISSNWSIVWLRYWSLVTGAWVLSNVGVLMTRCNIVTVNIIEPRPNTNICQCVANNLQARANCFSQFVISEIKYWYRKLIDNAAPGLSSIMKMQQANNVTLVHLNKIEFHLFILNDAYMMYNL